MGLVAVSLIPLQKVNRPSGLLVECESLMILRALEGHPVPRGQCSAIHASQDKNGVGVVQFISM